MSDDFSDDDFVDLTDVNIKQLMKPSRPNFNKKSNVKNYNYIKPSEQRMLDDINKKEKKTFKSLNKKAKV